MNGIYFIKIISLIFPTIFFFGGIFLFIKNWNNLISRLIASLIIIISSISLANEFFIKPNINEIKKENKRFENLESNNVELIKIKINYINGKFIEKRIIDNKKIKQIVDNLMFNEIIIWESDDYTPDNCYIIELQMINGKNMNFDICESTDNRTFINLLYEKNKKLYSITEYRNRTIKGLKIFNK